MQDRNGSFPTTSLSRQALAPIYADLAAGRISRAEALDRIVALRRAPAAIRAPLVVASPMWSASSRGALVSRRWTERRVLLLDIGSATALTTLLPAGQVETLELPSAGDPPARYAALAAECLQRVQAMLASRPSGDVLFQVVVAEGDTEALQAGVAGLLRTATRENPRFKGQVVFVRGDATAAAIAQQLEQAQAHGDEAVMRFERGTQPMGLRWRPAPVSISVAPFPYREHGSYLITGGLGGLGRLFARDILSNTQHARVILTGRQASSGDSEPRLAALQAIGGQRVSYVSLDLDDAAQVQRLIDTQTRDGHRLHGILHAAGMTADSFILKKSADELANVLAPKVRGTWLLDRATRDLDLDFFALFSSVASVFGNVGQADYAAANGFLDEFATWRQKQVALGNRRGRTVSIAWPLWAEGGMRLPEAHDSAIAALTGDPLSTEDGLHAFRIALASPSPRCMVLAGDGAAAGLTDGTATAARSADGTRQDAEGDPAQWLDKARDVLRRVFASVLKIEATRLGWDTPLDRFGIDSIVAMRLTAEIEKEFGPQSKTLLFEYRSIDDLAHYLVASYPARLQALVSAGRQTRSRAAAPIVPARPVRTAAPVAVGAAPSRFEPIAIVGLSGRYPGARDLETFWANLRDGVDCVVEVPADRWDWRDYYSDDRTAAGRHYSRWGGFIEGVDEFDPQFFNIAPREARQIDPQERLFLQHAWMAIEDAGYTRAALSAGGDVGVYVGMMYSEYQLFAAEASVRGQRLGVAGSFASTANRVSFALDLHGPSMTLDTMCSSSLTAIHLACQDLRLGRTAMAIAGGVNVTIHPNKYLALSAGQFISSEGHCQSFGEGGDGYIPGEGVGAVVLKRLADAERDGDVIHGVIRGSALNHGGRTNGYTVPNPQAQAAAIERALSEAGVDVRRIGYVEAHGTGTRLGDPIEIAALSRAFGPAAEKGGCLIGSAKSNIGHCEAAAGIAGLTKVLLQMRHGQVVPSLHSARLNPHIDFASSPFTVNQTLRAWEAPVVEGRRAPRMAGLSSFGAGGSNAHMVVEAYEATAMALPDGPVVLVLSGRTAEALRGRVSDLLTYLEDRPAALASVAWTLQIGREAMNERLACVAADVPGAIAQLRAYLEGEEIEGLFAGQAQQHRESVAWFAEDAELREAVARWASAGRLERVAQAWVRGVEIPWSALHGGRTLPKTSLPTYPFARERYWLDLPKADIAPGASRLHPLLHENVSDLRGQRFRSRFGEAIGAWDVLEMARAAAVRALGVDDATPLGLYDVAWFDTPRHDDVLDVQVWQDDDGDVVLQVVRADADALLMQGAVRLANDDVVANEPSPDDVRVSLAPLPNAASSNAGIVLGEALLDALLGADGETHAVLTLDTVHIRANVSAGGVVHIHRRVGEGGLIEFDADVRDARGHVAIVLRGLVAERKQDGGTASRDLPTIDGCIFDEPTSGVIRIALASAQSWDAALAALDGVEDVKAVVLTTTAHDSDTSLPADAFAATTTRLRNAAYPVIAACLGDAIGASWWLALSCDALVVSSEGHYGLDEASWSLAGAVRRRTGVVDVAVRPGAAWQAAGWSGRVVPAAQVDEEALSLARALAEKPADALRLLKAHLWRGEMDAPFEVSAAVADAPALVRVDAREVSAVRRQLDEAIARGASSVVLWSEVAPFEDGVEANAIASLCAWLAEAPVPVVAALGGDAQGAAWLGLLACDEVVHAAEGWYGAQGVLDATPLSGWAGVCLPLHLGHEGRRALLDGESRQGRAWRGAQVANAGDVLSRAQALARRWAGQPAAVLSAWRQARRVPSVVWESTSEALPAAGPITLSNAVVKATAQADGVLLIELCDRDARNMFSEALVRGVEEAFAHAASQPYRAVVVTGYDTYFASGGTRESLLAIQSGQARFTDFTIFRLPMSCPVPVIAAMQGHGIGAGWSLGLFADLGFYAEEARYVSPYMDYGFTPGAGATLMAPARLGQALGRESLLSAREYTGRALGERGVGEAVLPRAEVLPAALALASRMARHPRHRLVGLKQLWNVGLANRVDDVIARELEMHARTFVGNAATSRRIEGRFGQAGSDKVQATVTPTQRPSPQSVKDTLRRLLATELQLDADRIADDAPFIDLGLDSISGVNWVRRINEAYGLAVEATRVYSHPTIGQLAAHVSASLPEPVALQAPVTPDPAETTPAPAVTTRRLPAPRRRPQGAPVVRRTAEPEAIAVIGMAGRFPQANDLDAFWRNLAEGRDCIDEVPASRWSVDRYYRAGAAEPGHTNSRWMGALDGHDQFDPLFFSISPKEAEHMDPQQRLFLQTCWHAFEDAAYGPRSLAGTRCGVFVGCAGGDYQHLTSDQRLTATGFTGNANSILAGRVAYLLDLQGPCLSIDTACSSSLVAMSHACESLVNGTADMALAGGVYVMVGPDMHIKTAQAGMLSTDGRCFAFDARANGFVPGEGVGAVVLKRLADAERDGDRIHGVIRGWGVNQDGRTNGITAPNPVAQQRLQRGVYERFAIDPAQIQLIEAHGTGTKLGDPIEVQALKDSFAAYTRREGYCALGSVKSNIGHTLTAAGVAGFLKLLLALRHRQLPPTAQFERLNEHIALEGSPFFVNAQLTPWMVGEGERRRAALNSFGFSGTNAHLVVEEYDAPVVASPKGEALCVLSARTPEALRTLATALAERLERDGSDWLDLAYTLQVGREAMEERLAFVADDAATAAARLRGWLAGERGGVHVGQAGRQREAVAMFAGDEDLRRTADGWLREGRLEKLGEWWVRGLDHDWAQLHRERTPRRVDVPLYPFAKETYWVDGANSAVPAHFGTAHPLVHENVSNLDVARYRCHVAAVKGGVDAATVLAFVRAAVARAQERADEASVVLEDVAWERNPDAAVSYTVSLWPDEAGVAFEVTADDDEAIIVHGLAVMDESAGEDQASRVVSEIVSNEAPSTLWKSGVVWSRDIGGARVSRLDTRQKPRFALAAAADMASGESASLARPRFTLGAPDAFQPGSVNAVAGSLRITDIAPAVWTLHVTMDDVGSVAAWASAVSDACEVIAKGDLRALIVMVDGASAADVSAASVWMAFVRNLRDMPVPVVAAVRDAIGASWWLALSCDALVVSSGGHYGLDEGSWSLAGAVRRRTGVVDVAVRPGAAWQAAGWSGRVVPAAQVDEEALSLARALAEKPADALRLLKAHLWRGERDAPFEVSAAVADAPALVRVDAREVSAVRRQLDEAIARGASSVVLWSEVAPFEDGVEANAIASLCAWLAEAPVPVVAALGGDAQGAAWLGLLACDEVVHAAEGWYGAQGVLDATPLSGWAGVCLPLHLGHEGRRALLDGESRQGRAWRGAQVAASGEVLGRAQNLARRWAGQPAAVRSAWRQARRVPSVVWESTSEALPTAGPVVLSSTAVKATAQADGVLLIELCDRDARNMFSEALVRGVEEAFAHAASQPYRAVVVTGYDTYFASGGTRESLLAIQSGQARFTDFTIFRLPMSCPVPVIAAMQGHGIGAGWSLGLFADLGFYAEEARYVSPYMDYGFTPGAGATLMAPARLGQALGRESLLSAREYTGRALGERGVGEAVLPRAEVLPAALALASRMARHPRHRLVGLKALWNVGLAERVDETFACELDMHDKTFVGRDDTSRFIQARFEALAKTPAPKPAASKPLPAAAPMASPTKVAVRSPDAVAAKLRQGLDIELHLQGRPIDDDMEFIQLGLDSISGVTWVRRINEDFGTAIEATAIYSYPTIRQLAAYIASLLPSESVMEETARSEAPAATPAPSRPALRRRVTSRQRQASPAQAMDRIAIIGMSGRYAGADDLDAFWQQIVEGRDAIREIPASRWAIDDFYDPNPEAPDRMMSRWLGAMDDVDCFDTLFFRISPDEAEQMDPQHRLFLQEAYHAFEDAGYTSRALSRSRCGVYLGISTNDYALLLARSGVVSAPVTANSYSIAAARIAYHLNLNGPAISVDTACSSSLVSLHLACQALRTGEVDMALAGGVSLWLAPESYLALSQAGMLSPSGRCKAFDDSADGIVMGDGVGALVLKRLADAERDGDRILGVVAGSGINQDGRTNGITAPSAVSQAELERDVHRRFGIDADGIDYVETHGTGTPLGDPIELEALASVFRESTSRRNYCALGSVKSNIGHTSSAAGVASVQKVLLSLRHATIAPTLHVTRENHHFDFAGSPFFVNREATPWPTREDRVRRACVNSFGYSGTNAHVVIEEYRASRPAVTSSRPASPGGQVVTLSARDAEALVRRVTDFAAWLEVHPHADVAAIAFTTQCRRDAMDARVALVATDARGLAQAARTWLERGVRKHVRPDDAALALWLATRDMTRLAEAWEAGMDVPWDTLHEGARMVTSLPLYPFARERYWVGGASVAAPAAAPAVGDAAWIEEVLGRVENDELDTAQAVALLGALQ